MPISPRTPDARNAATARPCESRRWWIARPARPHVADARREHAGAVAHHRGHDRLVVGDPASHPIAEPGVHERRVVREALRGRALRPAAQVLQRLRQVPVVERRAGLDPGGEQLVDQPRVEVEPLRVGLARAERLHARPRDREAVGLQAEPLHQRDVLAEAPVVVAGHVAGVAALHAPGLLAEHVPDRETLAVGPRRRPRSDTRPSPRPTGSPSGKRRNAMRPSYQAPIARCADGGHARGL